MAVPTEYTVVTTWGSDVYVDTWADLGNTEVTRRIAEAKFLHEYDKSEPEFIEGMREQYLYPHE